MYFSTELFLNGIILFIGITLYSIIIDVLFGHPTFWKSFNIEKYSYSTILNLFKYYTSTKASIFNEKDGNYRNDVRFKCMHYLPESCMYQVLSYLNASDLLRLNLCNRHYCQLVNQIKVWKHLYHVTFESIILSSILSLSTCAVSFSNNITFIEYLNGIDKVYFVATDMRSLKRIKRHYFRILYDYLDYLLLYFQYNVPQALKESSMSQFLPSSSSSSSSISSVNSTHYNTPTQFSPNSTTSHNIISSATSRSDHNHFNDYIILRVYNQIMCIPEEFVINYHPGGSEIILHYDRQNASNLFNIANHSVYALNEMKSYIIWDLQRFRDK